MDLPIDLPGDEIRAICERYSIAHLALFGSVLRDDFRPDSDIDVFVEFRPGVQLGLRFLQLERELSSAFGNRRVDLIRARYLNARLRERVRSTARTLYAA